MSKESKESWQILNLDEGLEDKRESLGLPKFGREDARTHRSDVEGEDAVLVTWLSFMSLSYLHLPTYVLPMSYLPIHYTIHCPYVLSAGVCEGWQETHHGRWLGGGSSVGDVADVAPHVLHVAGGLFLHCARGEIRNLRAWGEAVRNEKWMKTKWNE